MEVEYTVAHIRTRQTKVRAELMTERSTVLETGRQLSGVIGRNRIRAKTLTDNLGRGLTNIGDLQAEEEQLANAERAITITGSAEGIAVVPAGKRFVIDPHEDLGGREFKAPTVTLKSKDTK
jgi:hypothetical protein